MILWSFGLPAWDNHSGCMDMRVFSTNQTREQYVETQIARSDSKFTYCKVSVDDVASYRDVILFDITRTGRDPNIGPILCLGTRNGREVDLFRAQFFGSGIQRYLIKVFERRTHSFVSRVPRLESIGRSEVGKIAQDSVIGVEINPKATRSDIWIGSSIRCL